MTEVEPEYDVNERDNWYALDEYETALCPQCRNLRTVCENPDVDWYPQRAVCWTTAAQEVATRRFYEKHKDAKPDRAGYKPTDGTVVWISDADLTPGDDFL